VKLSLTAFCFVLLVKAGFADQRSLNAVLERATSAFDQGRLEEAERQLDAAARVDPKKPEISNLRGAIFTRQKRYEEAAQQFNQALALDPKFYPAKVNLAEVKMLEGRYGEASQEYQALKDADPDSEALDFKLVLCSLLDGDPGRARGIVDLMKFPGKTPAYYYARAAIAQHGGNNELAQKYLENVKKYYSETQCRYFSQSLKEVDLSSSNAARPEKIPDLPSGDLGNSKTGSK